MLRRSVYLCPYAIRERATLLFLSSLFRFIRRTAGSVYIQQCVILILKDHSLWTFTSHVLLLVLTLLLLVLILLVLFIFLLPLIIILLPLIIILLLIFLLTTLHYIIPYS